MHRTVLRDSPGEEPEVDYPRGGGVAMPFLEHTVLAPAPGPMTAGQPSKEWRKSLLKIISSFRSLEALEGWSLLPVKGDRLRPLACSSLVHLAA